MLKTLVTEQNSSRGKESDGGVTGNGKGEKLGYDSAIIGVGKSTFSFRQVFLYLPPTKLTLIDCALSDAS